MPKVKKQPAPAKAKRTKKAKEEVFPPLPEAITEGQKPTLSQLFRKYATVHALKQEKTEAISQIQVALLPIDAALTDIEEQIDTQLKEQGLIKGGMEGFNFNYSSSSRTVVEDESLLPESCWTPKVDLTKVKQFLADYDEETAKAEFGAYILKSKLLKIKPAEEK